MGDYIGENYTVFQGGARSFDYSSYGSPSLKLGQRVREQA